MPLVSLSWERRHLAGFAVLSPTRAAIGQKSKALNATEQG
jgi:hypothetical protein